MKLKFINILLFFLVFHLSYSQKTVPEVLKKYNNQSIPYISVNTLALSNSQSIVLDAREIKEYRVSHIKNAIHVGYDDFDIKSVQTKIPNKDSKIIVYCSIGIRSEDIAEKLKKVGYTHVLNLYGGLFEWKNKDFKIYNSKGKVTDSVHVYSKFWSKWLVKGIKIYD